MSDVGIFVETVGILRVKWRERSNPTRATGGGKPNADTEADQFISARAVARGGDSDMAVRLFEDAIARAPQFDAAVEAQAELLDMTGHSEEAKAKYTEARSIRAATRQGPPDRPFAVRQRGNFRSEISAYDTVLRSLKKNALPYIARGNAYLTSGKPEQALADYERALKLKPGLLDVQAIKAEALSAMGKYDEALTTIDAVLTARPSDAEALSTRSVILMGLGRPDDANADLNRQLALLPTSQAAACACIALRLAALRAGLRRTRQRYRQAAARSLLASLSGDGPDAPWPAAGFDAPVVAQALWPARLLAFQAGRAQRAGRDGSRPTPDCRRGGGPGSRSARMSRAVTLEVAKRHWRLVVDRAALSLIEHAAARNELKRIGGAELFSSHITWTRVGCSR